MICTRTELFMSILRETIRLMAEIDEVTEVHCGFTLTRSQQDRKGF